MGEAGRASFRNGVGGSWAEQTGLGARLAQSSAWGILGQAVMLLTSFVATPFIIRYLGSERYGLLAFINLLILYLAFADFGMGAASTRFAAVSVSRKDEKGEAAVSWAAFMIGISSACGLAAALAFGGRQTCIRLFNIAGHLAPEALGALAFAALAVLFNALAGIVRTPQLSRLRNGLAVSVTTGAGVLQAAGTVLVLRAGFGVSEVAAVIAAAAGSGLVASALISLWLAPHVFKPSWDRRLFRPLLAYGLQVLATALLGTIIVHGEKFLLVRLESVRELAFYNIAFTLAGLLGVLPTALSQPIMPAFVHVIHAEGPERLSRLYHSAFRGLILVLAPAALVLSLAARPFLNAWAGPEFGAESQLPLFILAAGWVPSAAAYVPRSLLAARGRLDVLVRYQAAQLVPYFILAALLIRAFGAAGAAAAWSLRVAAECILLGRAVARQEGFEGAWTVADRTRMLAALGVLFVPAVLVWQLFGAKAATAVTVVFCLPAYVCIAWRWLLAAEEKLWLRHFLDGALRGLRLHSGCDPR